MSYLKNPSNQLIVNQINKDNNTTLTVSDISLGNPQTGTGSGNTDMAVLANAGKYVGSVVTHFNRLDLTKMFDRIKVILDTDTMYNDTSSLLSDFNSKYGMTIQTSEITNLPVDVSNSNSDGFIMHTITIVNSSCKAFINTIDVLIRPSSFEKALTTEAGEPLMTEDGNYYLTYQ